MGGLQGGCRRRRRPCGMRKTGDQLGLEPLPLSKIRDRSTEGNGRPHRTAVFDFRFRARYEPQLVPESMCSRRPDPVRHSPVCKGGEPEGRTLLLRKTTAPIGVSCGVHSSQIFSLTPLGDFCALRAQANFHSNLRKSRLAPSASLDS